MNVSGRWWRMAGGILVIAVLVYLVRHVVQSWPAVYAYPWQWRVGPLALSCALAVCAYAVLTRAWRSVLRAIGLQLPLRTAYWIFLLSNLGRYLPGKFWQIGAAAWMGERIGLSARDIAPSMIVYQLYLIPVGAVMAFSWGPLPAQLDWPWLRPALWLVVVLAAAAAVWPHVLLRLLRPVTEALGIDPDRWRLATRRRLAIAVQCAAGWLLLGSAFGCFVWAVTPLPPNLIPHWGRAFIVAYLIGFAALVAPGGVGVREGVLALLFSTWMDPGPAAALALLSRLWATLTEILALIPAWYWARRDLRQISRD